MSSGEEVGGKVTKWEAPGLGGGGRRFLAGKTKYTFIEQHWRHGGEIAELEEERKELEMSKAA